MYKEDEVVFTDAIKSASKDNHLSDPEVLYALLDFWTAEFITAAAEARNIADAVANKIALILLGEDKDFEPVRKWNAPGGVDVFLRGALGIEEKEPLKIVRTAVLRYLNSVADLWVRIVKDPGFAVDGFQEEKHLLISEYAYLFRGVLPSVVSTAF